MEEESAEKNQELDMFDSITKKKNEIKSEMTVAYLMMSIVWSISAGIKQLSRPLFSEFFNNLCRNLDQKFPKY